MQWELGSNEQEEYVLGLGLTVQRASLRSSNGRASMIERESIVKNSSLQTKRIRVRLSVGGIRLSSHIASTGTVSARCDVGGAELPASLISRNFSATWPSCHVHSIQCCKLKNTS